jgi:hypothetical protein
MVQKVGNNVKKSLTISGLGIVVWELQAMQA